MRLQNSIICLVTSIAILASCRTGNNTNIPLFNTAPFKDYIVSHTGGMISRADPIKVKFALPVVAKEDIAKAPNAALFNISPSVKGQLHWENETTLVFTPEAWLNPSTIYTMQLKLSNLFQSLPEELQTFKFACRTYDPHISTTVDQLIVRGNEKTANYDVGGTIEASDVLDNADLEKVFSAQVKGKAVKTVWEHDGTEHRFFIKDIDRGNSGKAVKMSWKGADIGAKTNGEKTWNLPPTGTMTVVDVVVSENQEGQFVRVLFSDPVLNKDSQSGLVTIEGYAGETSHQIADNEIRLFPEERLSGTFRVLVSPGVRSADNQLSLNQAATFDIELNDIEPGLRLAGSGVIVPNSDPIYFPFEAVNLSGVEIEIFKIYDNNILQFLQENEVDGTGYMEQVGKIVHREHVNLRSIKPDANARKWTRYALDLSKFIAKDPACIYQVRLGFKQTDAMTYCAESGDRQIATNEEGSIEEDGSIMNLYSGWTGYYDGYSWENRSNPCFPEFYNSDRFISRNLLVSNIGIIAKGTEDNQWLVTTAEITSANPIPNATLVFYDYQKQAIATGTTNGEGQVSITLDRKPFAIVATSGKDKGYLKVMEGNNLPLADYDVSGNTLQKGLQGFIYTERGVWRPGDSIFLDFILDDQLAPLPQGLPVQLEVSNARGQKVFQKMLPAPVGKIYSSIIPTKDSDPTGNWLATVKIGGAIFTKKLLVETIQPNRMKIQLGIAESAPLLAWSPLGSPISVNWLHGAPAKNVQVIVERQLSESPLSLSAYKNYRFEGYDNLASQDPVVIFDAKVNEDGKANIDLAKAIGKLSNRPQLNATFKIRAIEPGGTPSSTTYTYPLKIYPHIVGVKGPNGHDFEYLELKKNHTFQIQSLDYRGTVSANRRVKATLYKSEQYWWYEEEYGEDGYQTKRGREMIASFNVETNAKGMVSLPIQLTDHGLYELEVADQGSNHASAIRFYGGPYGYFQQEGTVAKLDISLNKDTYNVGEQMVVSIPAGDAGQALITLESGNRIIASQWKSVKKGDNSFTFSTSKEMSPTVYISATLVQPHAQTVNDLPIRMFGVVPASITDKTTLLEPVIQMPASVEPEKTVTVTVSEKSKKAMHYTIALVDEGLLDITRFATPNPHNAFYARRALQVKTWDIYNQVLGAFGKDLQQVIAIGGDGAAKANPDKAKANRFPPMVRHIGPFLLKAGATGSHTIKIPNYIGAVRAMVVAASDAGAYGAAEKVLTVKKPLMLLANLPRTLSVGESINLPITVFAMDGKVKDVKVTVREKNGKVNFPKGGMVQLAFAKTGEKEAYFPLTVGNRVGISEFVIEATGGGFSASQTVQLDIKLPTNVQTEVTEGLIAGNQSWGHMFDEIGARGGATAMLEVSSMPAINLQKHLSYLLTYPYGCLEQTTSKAFAQLYVADITTLTKSQSDQNQKNIQAGIQMLSRFQRGGGFTYWPATSQYDDWCTSYAGHFLLSAKAKGFDIPATMLDQYLAYEQREAKQWRQRDGVDQQAYRLYVLSKAGKGDMGAMNRLREAPQKSTLATWLLAGAYHLAGNTKESAVLANNLSTQPNRARELSNTYGSSLRDAAVCAIVLQDMGKKQEASKVAIDIAKAVGKNEFYSTQELAFVLQAIAGFADQGGSEAMQFEVTMPNGKTIKAGSSKPIMQLALPITNAKGNDIKVKNLKNQSLFVRLIQTGQPFMEKEVATSDGLKVTVNYKSAVGPIDVIRLSQGTDFWAEVTVEKTGTRYSSYQELALSQIFPSGWEIMNSRVDGINITTTNSSYEYQDIRDDRVFTFFDVGNEPKTFIVRLSATYPGRYYLPGVSCKAMYDETIQSTTAGKWVEVISN